MNSSSSRSMDATPPRVDQHVTDATADVHPPPVAPKRERKRRRNSTRSSDSTTDGNQQQQPPSEVTVDEDSIEEKADNNVTKATVSTPSQWACPACTFLNDVSRCFCEMCETPNPSPSGTARGADNKSMEWSCVACTMKNPPTMRMCGICGTINPNPVLPAGITIAKRSMAMDLLSDDDDDSSVDDDEDNDDLDDDSDDDGDDSVESDESDEDMTSEDSKTWMCRLCDNGRVIPASEASCSECHLRRPPKSKSAKFIKQVEKRMKKEQVKAREKKKKEKKKELVRKNAYGVSSYVLRKLAKEPSSSKLIDTMQTLTHTLAMMEASADSVWGGPMRGASISIGGFSGAPSDEAKDPEILTVLADIFRSCEKKYPLEVRLLAVQSINYLTKMDHHLFKRSMIVDIIEMYVSDLLQWEATKASVEGNSVQFKNAQMIVEECLNGIYSVCIFEGFALRELTTVRNFDGYLHFLSFIVADDSGFHPSVIMTALELLQKCCIRMRWSASSKTSRHASGNATSSSAGGSLRSRKRQQPDGDGLMNLELLKKLVNLLRQLLHHKHVPLHVKAAKCLLLVFHRVPFQKPEVITELVTVPVLCEFVDLVINSNGEESDDSRHGIISLLIHLFDNRPQVVTLFVQENMYTTLFDGMLPLLQSSSTVLVTSALKLTALLARVVCRKHSSSPSTNHAIDIEVNPTSVVSTSQNPSSSVNRNRTRLDSSSDPDVMSTLLLDFIRADSITAVNALLKDGADLNFPKTLDSHGKEIEKPLQVAAEFASLAMVRFLVKRGADIHQLGPGGTALHVAAKTGRCDVVSFLLQCGASISAVDRDGKNVMECIDIDQRTDGADAVPSPVRKLLELSKKRALGTEESDASEGDGPARIRARSWFFTPDDDDDYDDEDDGMDDEEHDDEDSAYFMDYDEDDEEDDDDDEYGRRHEHIIEDEDIPSDEEGIQADNDMDTEHDIDDAMDTGQTKATGNKRRFDSISSESNSQRSRILTDEHNKTTMEASTVAHNDHTDDGEASLRRYGFTATSEQIYAFSSSGLKCLLSVLHYIDIQNVERAVVSTLACLLEMAPSQLIRSMQEVDLVLILDIVHFLLQGQKRNEHSDGTATSSGSTASATKLQTASNATLSNQQKSNLSSFILAMRILQAIIRKSSPESSILYQIERRGICEQIEELNHATACWVNTCSDSHERGPQDTIFGRGLALLESLRNNVMESGMLHLHKLKNLARRLNEITAESMLTEQDLALVDLVELFEQPNSITTYEFKQSELLPAVIRFLSPNEEVDENRVKALMNAFERYPQALKHLISRLQSIITQEESFPLVSFNSGKGRELYPLTRQLTISFFRHQYQDGKDSIEKRDSAGKRSDAKQVKLIQASPLTHFQSFERTICRSLPVIDQKLSTLYVNLVGHCIQKVIDGKWKKFWVCGYDDTRSYHLLKPMGGTADDLVEMVIHDSQFKLLGPVEVYKQVTLNLELFGTLVPASNNTTPNNGKKRKKKKRKLSSAQKSEASDGLHLCQVEVKNDASLDLGKMKGAWYAGVIIDDEENKTGLSIKKRDFESIVHPHGFYSVKLLNGKKIRQVPADSLRARSNAPQVGSIVEVDGVLGETTKVYNESSNSEKDPVFDVKISRDIEKVRVKKDRIRYPASHMSNKKQSDDSQQIEAMSIRRLFPARESSAVAGTVGDHVWIVPPSTSSVKDIAVSGIIKSFPSGLESIRESTTVNVEVSFGISQSSLVIKVEQDRVLNFGSGSRSGTGSSRLLAALQMASGRGSHSNLFSGHNGSAIHRAFQQVAGSMRSDMEFGRYSNGVGHSNSPFDQLRQLLSQVSRGNSAVSEAEGHDQTGVVVADNGQSTEDASLISSTSEVDSSGVESGSTAAMNSMPSSSSRVHQKTKQSKEQRSGDLTSCNDKVWEVLKTVDSKPEWICTYAPKVNLVLGYHGREAVDISINSSSAAYDSDSQYKSLDRKRNVGDGNERASSVFVVFNREKGLYEANPRAEEIFQDIFSSFNPSAASPSPKKKRKIGAPIASGPVRQITWDIENFCAFIKAVLRLSKRSVPVRISMSDQCILFSKHALPTSRRRKLDSNGFIAVMTDLCKDPAKSKLILKYIRSIGYSDVLLQPSTKQYHCEEKEECEDDDASATLAPGDAAAKRRKNELRGFPSDQNVLKCIDEMQEHFDHNANGATDSLMAGLHPWKYTYKLSCDFKVDWSVPPSASGRVVHDKVEETSVIDFTRKRLVIMRGDDQDSMDDFKWLEPSNSTRLAMSNKTPPTVANAVRLLRYLFEFKSNSVIDDENMWTSPRLYNKLETQLQDVLSISSGIYPKWCDRVVTNCKFFFPRELREKFFRATSFGCTRSLHWFRNQLNLDDNNNSSAGESLSVTGGISNQEISITPIPKERVKVLRANILNSAEAVMKMHAKRKAILDIVFVGEKGYGSGVTAAFYSATAHALQSCAENCKKDMRCWVPGQDDDDISTEGEENEAIIRHANGLFPFPHQSPSPRLVERFRMMGRLAGKALMDERLLPLPLSTQFMKLVVGDSFGVEEIVDIFGSAGKILYSMYTAAKQLNSDLSGGVVHKIQIDSMDLQEWLDAVSFTFIDPLSQESLCVGGEDKAVTIENLTEYVNKVLGLWLDRGIHAQVLAFRQGIGEVLPLAKLNLLFIPEILSMLCGDADITWDSVLLIKSMKLAHGYTKDSLPVQYFVEVLNEMTVPQRRAFLLYATGCPNLPPGGFQTLKPPFEVVRRVVDTDDVDRALPFARTCTNTLHLPAYSSKDVLAKQLIFAIENSRGVIDRD